MCGYAARRRILFSKLTNPLMPAFCLGKICWSFIRWSPKQLWQCLHLPLNGNSIGSDKLLKQFLYWIVGLCYAIYCLLQQHRTVSYIQILQSLVMDALLTNGHQRSAVYLTKSILATMSMGSKMVLCRLVWATQPDAIFNKSPSCKAQFSSRT